MSESLPNFVITDDETRAVAESGAELAKTFLRALKNRVVAHAHKAAVAGIIAVGNDVINGADVIQKTIQLRALFQRMAHPDEMPVKPDERAEQGIGDGTQLEIIPARALGGAGVMNVA